MNRANKPSQERCEELWGGEGGAHKLSVLSKCVSNPLSCAAPGERDPPQPPDPAALLRLSGLTSSTAPPPKKKVSHCFLSIISAVRAQPQPLPHLPRVLEERLSVKTAPLKEKLDINE